MSKQIKLDNGWVIEDARNLHFTGKILCDLFDDYDEEVLEWLEGDSFTLYIGPELRGDGGSDQHHPDFYELLEPLIGDLGEVGSSECAHSIDRKDVELAMGRADATFEEVCAFIATRLKPAGIVFALPEED